MAGLKVQCSIMEGHVKGGLQESPVKALNGNKALANVDQYAFSYVRFDMGWTAFKSSEGGDPSVENPLRFNSTTIPLLAYLKLVTVFNGVNTYTETQTWDLYGNYTDVNGFPPDFYIERGDFIGETQTSPTEFVQTWVGGTITFTYSVPYTFEAACANAKSLLDGINLLDLATTYPISGTPFHFCYNPQIGENGWSSANATNIIYATWDSSGNVVYDVNGPGDFTGNPSAWTGWVIFIVGGSGWYDTKVCCKKMARLAPVDKYNVINPTLLNKSSQKYEVVGSSVVPLVSPTEEIFLPEMVPNYGAARFTYNPNATNPPAGSAQSAGSSDGVGGQDNTSDL